MILQDPGRGEVEDVMSRPEFQYPKSIMERLGDWIGERLESLFDRLPGVDAPAASFGGGAGSLVGWLLLFLALVVVVAVVVMVVRRWVPRQDEKADPLSTVETEHRRAAREWGADADRFEAAGEWKLAMRARFRELVRTLVDRSQVADLAGRTTRELLADLAGTTPDAVDQFESACLLFELPWYAHVSTGPDENRDIRALAAQVLAAEVQTPLDQGPQVVPGRVEMPVEP